MVYFDEKILKIFGKSMNFRGYALDSFVMGYFMNTSRIAILSTVNNLNELGDEADKDKIDRLIKEIGDYDFEKQIEFGEFLADKLKEYPEVVKKVADDISDLNENILASFLAYAPERYVIELATYIKEKKDETDAMRAFFDKVSSQI